MRWPWFGFAALCLWQASSWLLPLGERPSALERLWWACSAALLAAGVVAAARRVSLRGVAWLRLAVASVALIGAPAVLVASAGAELAETTIAVAFALTPVVVVLVRSARRGGEAGAAALVPCLAGVAGVMLVVPYATPVSAAAWWALGKVLAAVALTGWGSVELHALAAEAGVGRTVLAAAAGNLLLLTVTAPPHAPVGWGMVAVAAVGAQAGALVLLVWLVARIEPVRMAARFLVAPLLTILEGALLLRPELDARLVAGVLLLAGGAWWLVGRGGRVDAEVLSLR